MVDLKKDQKVLRSAAAGKVSADPNASSVPCCLARGINGITHAQLVLTGQSVRGVICGGLGKGKGWTEIRTLSSQKQVILNGVIADDAAASG